METGYILKEIWGTVIRRGNDAKVSKPTGSLLQPSSYSCVLKIILKSRALRDFPGGQVVENLHSQCRGSSSIPGQGSRSRMLQLGASMPKLKRSLMPQGEFPWWLKWLIIHLKWRRPRFNPWIGNIPWRREWLPTPVFLLGEFNGQRSLVGYSPWGCKESDTTEQLTHTHTHTHTHIHTHTRC